MHSGIRQTNEPGCYSLDALQRYAVELLASIPTSLMLSLNCYTVFLDGLLTNEFFVILTIARIHASCTVTSSTGNHKRTRLDRSAVSGFVCSARMEQAFY